jgi:hypothetical protein
MGLHGVLFSSKRIGLVRARHTADLSSLAANELSILLASRRPRASEQSYVRIRLGAFYRVYFLAKGEHTARAWARVRKAMKQ